MSRNRIVADLCLAMVLVVGGARIHKDWKQFQRQHNVDDVQPQPDPAIAAPAIKASIPVASNAWGEIANGNVFSFDRSDVPAVPAVTVMRGPSQPKPFLFGTMAVGGPLMALVGRGQAGNRAYRPMVVGEVIDGWTLVQVGDKSIVVESGGERQTVLMNDPSAQLPRDYSRTQGLAQNPAQVVPKSPAAEILRPSPSAPAAQSSVPGDETAAPKTRVIHTPFGDKVVPVP